MLRSEFLAAALAPALRPGNLAAVERASGGRLGVSAIDLRNGRSVNYRAHDRFPLASTFKLPLVMAVLARADGGRPFPDRLHVGPAEKLDVYSPYVAAELRRSPRGVTLPTAALCAAAIELSDNIAANVLLHRLGGPAALNAFLRRLGDVDTRLVHDEPALNDALPGAPGDSTTPAAMARLAARVAQGSVLSRASNARLMTWLYACKTGRTRLRAGAPRGWRVGDKTGTTAGAANDVAIFFPPSGPAIAIAAYLYGDGAAAVKDAALAQVARAAVRALRP